MTKIPPTLFKMSSNLIDWHFCNVIKYKIGDKSFPDSPKIAYPRPDYNKESQHKIESYRPILIFNMTKEQSQVVWPEIQHAFLY